MTSDHPPSRPPDHQARHPDLDALADLDAGLLDPASAAGLTTHVGSCPSCAATLRAFGAVRADLRSLPTLQMPDSVAARLDVTLAELRSAGPGEAPSRPGTPEGGARQAGPPRAEGDPPVPTDSRPVRQEVEQGQPPHGPDDGEDTDGEDTDGDDIDEVAIALFGERRRERSRRMTTMVAASVVALAALVGAGTAVLRGTQEDSSLTRSAAVPGAQDGGSAGDARARPPSATLTAPPEVYSPPGGPVPPSAAQASPSAGASGAASVPRYTKQTLAAEVADLERQASLATVSAAGLAGPGGAMADSSRRRDCAGSIPGATGTLTAVRQVVFEGTPAFVFVYRDGEPRVVVVAADCGLKRGSAATVLYRLGE
jgi:hypothetical protein